MIKCDEANREVTLIQNVGGKQFGRTYHFDKVFSPGTTQESLYDSAISPIVEEVLQGFNCTIFAYGQTGTGKTHTMTGDISGGGDLIEGAGVIPRAIQQIFSYLEGMAGATEYTVKCCFLELYNEEITDLLAIGAEPPKVRILEDRTGVVMQGLEEPHVKGSKEIFSLLETGNARRRTAETLLNKQSSRSHSVFIVTVSVREVLAEGEEVIRVGKLYLVDLAGSENVSRSGAVDQRAKEAGNINKSLLTLGRVITALVEGQGHVPYRDSKLTRLLRDSLGGRTKTCIIATIAPTVQCQEETLSTLDYAHRAKNIKNKPEVNQRISKTTHLKDMAKEIARLKAELVATREKNGVYLPAAQYEEECQERAALAARVEELTEETTTAAARFEEEKAALVEEWEGRVAEVRAQLDDTSAKLDATRADLSVAKEDIEERNYMLKEHRRCEVGLAGHARTLTDELSAAAADVAQLFRRVDAKNGIEDGNLAVVKGMRDAAVERLGALEAAVKAVAGAQADRFAQAQATLEEMGQRKGAAAEALQEQMAALQAKIEGVGAMGSEAAESMAARGKAALGELGTSQEEFHAAAQAAAAEAAASLEATQKALADSTKEEKAVLEGLLDGQRAAAAAVGGAIDALVAAVQHQLENAKAEAEAASAAVGQSLAAQAAAAESMEAQFSAAARQEQAQLVSQISELIAGFVGRAEGQVKSAAAGMKAQLTADGEALQMQVGALATHADTSLKALSANAAKAGSAQEKAAATLEEGGSNAIAAMEATAANAGALGSAASDAAAAAEAALAKHSKFVASIVNKESKAMDAAADKEAKKCGAGAKDAAAASATMHSALNSEAAADGEAVEALVSSTASGAGALAAFAAEQGAGLANVAAGVTRAVDEEYAVDAERNAVPAVRERHVPGRSEVDALCAPSAEVLSRQFKATRSDFPGAGHMSDGVDDVQSEEAELAAEAPAPVFEEQVASEGPEGEENVEPAEVGKVLSPSLAGQKRSRSPGTTPEESPSKLRAAFQKGERRRTGRRTAV